MESGPQATDAVNVAEARTGPLEGAPMIQRDIVVVGASAGGVEALGGLVRGLPAELPASVFVVLHLLSTGTSVLAPILSRAGTLEVSSARDEDAVERGHVYVAPPDRHMLLSDGTIRLTRGPRENGHRPAIDPLFRSAARAHGARVVGIILSGSLDDGVAGSRFVKDRGGTILAQDPEEALYSSMPELAIETGVVDHVAPVGGIAKEVARLIDLPVEIPDEPAPPEPPDHTTAWAPEDIKALGKPSPLTCPDCGGVLTEREDGGVLRFACYTGHAYSPDSLASEQSRSLEAALWSALRGLEERADLLTRMGRRGAPRHRATARQFLRKARAAEEEAALVREAIGRLDRLESEGVTQRAEPRGAT